ncbi:SGNH/GDSL hydrolase family protein [Lentzea sp. NEAU-D13]|uniref:SGNH/GDSL hydrolase family protein n=1 Tax=Lentzea alba TaxID=2714351 RepID=A0A7C9RS95_9PSEU|nr:SGNH/GDSL hydrolase family protein [Lentzea alba]NGY62225.1 SGNH/GDSL hydrolase family protein [Lentzea alba]
MRARRTPALLCALSVLLSSAVAVTARAAPAPEDSTAPAARSASPDSVRPAERAAVLGAGWEKSADRAVITAGDSTGFHVLVAEARDGYRWRTVASLSEPGFDADAWIGTLCVTSSGNRAVVAYAPRTFTNRPDLAQRGAFTAVVDLTGGSPVRKLAVQTSLSYFNPGCGPTESAVLTQEGTEDLGLTRLIEVNAVDGSTGKPIDVPGQLTSPVPTATGIVAADSGAVVRVRPDGTRTVVAPAKGVPYRLAADADGGVVFAQREDDTTSAVRRVLLTERGRGEATTLATGPTTGLSVRSSRGGQVHVTGDRKSSTRPATAAVALTDVPDTATISSSGELAVISALSTRTAVDPTATARVDISARSLVTGKALTLSVTPTAGAGGGAGPSPALPKAAAAADPHNPSDGTERTCSVPRNDPRNQVMQPKPRQVEWAVDQAVRGKLTVRREANWKGLGMPSYTPQGLFPPTALDGGGAVPAQVMLGIAAQESNMWQAARFALPGMTANPLIGNYFGIDYYNNDPGDDWTIRWGKADCGYGVMQITDGMRLAGKEKPGETALPENQQRAIALDFAANVARGVRMVQDKWNQTRRAGLVLNNGSHDRIENWFFAVWAYNSGFYPQSSAGQNDGAWGVGWLNNPVNPRYPADRDSFLETSYADAAEPQKWPYPEKVMGWAGHPIEIPESPGVMVHGYRAAWWLTDNDRYNVRPAPWQFCDQSNQCDPNALVVPDAPDVIGEPAGPCKHRNANGKYDLKCWYHQSNTWKDDCQKTCGRELLRFDEGYAYQEDGTSHPPNCVLTGLPPNTMLIDDQPTSVPSIRPGCAKEFTNAGSFRFDFPIADIAGDYPAKVDIHQIGTGFGGQFWMSNTHRDVVRRANGIWTFNRSPGAWGRVLVHLPVVGARTQQARYELDLDGNGTFDRVRFLPQEIQRNGWVSLGVYEFHGSPVIRLSNITDDGNSTVRVAWDAVAIQTLQAKPKHFVAALGDSYSSGEGASTYFPQSDANHGTPMWNACRRSQDAYVRKVVLPGDTASVGALVDRFDENHELGFVACSGARTRNVDEGSRPDSWDRPQDYDEGEGQFHEVAQVDSGVLDGNTTLVTLTIGGNDFAAFPAALTDCATPMVDCTLLGGWGDRQIQKIDSIKWNVLALLETIHERAPNADIVLLGYPKIISTEQACLGAYTFNENERWMLGQLAQHMATRQREAAETLRSTGIPVHFADAIPEFAGHAACDSPAWIHGTRIGPYGEGDFHSNDKASALCLPEIIGTGNSPCLSRESFHPDPSGTAAYARVLRRGLDEIRYGS